MLSCPRMHLHAVPPLPCPQVRAALSLWDGSGSFLFTSSMGVCAVDDGGRVDETNCPVVALGAGASTDKLLGAEEAVLQVRRAWCRHACVHLRIGTPYTPPDVMHIIHTTRWYAYHTYHITSYILHAVIFASEIYASSAAQSSVLRWPLGCFSPMHVHACVL